MKEGFMIREIAGTHIVVPVGQRVVEFNGLINLSESGAFLWRRMSEDSTKEQLVRFILEEYEIDEQTAETDVSEFIAMLAEKGLIEA